MMKITRRKVGLLVFLLAVGGAVWWAFPSKVMKQVQKPREGKPLNAKVAIVFSANYDIGFGGIEKLYHFDIHKYANIYKRLVADGLLTPPDVFVPDHVAAEDLRLVHSQEYLNKLRDSKNVAEYLEFEPVGALPASVVDAFFLRAFRYVTGGTILASRLALKYGIGINLGGGYHHAQPDKGGGFCVYADVPIAVRKLQKEGLIRRALLVDLDAHQGNGNAICFKGDDQVFTFDIHNRDIYPAPKAECDMGIGLTGLVNDERYLAVLRENLPKAMGQARPDIVYLLAGTDVYEDDRLGHMGLTPAGIRVRDGYVVDEAVKRRIPVVMVLSGGYCPQSWRLSHNSIAAILKKYGREGAQ